MQIESRKPHTIVVWDPFVRLFHWSLVASFVAAWLSADEFDDFHEVAGYVAGGLVLFRLIWGFAGPRYALFSQFVRPPKAVLAYIGDMARAREARYLGHNPPGGMMVVALVAGICLLSITGFLLTFDMDAAEDLHEGLANIMLVLVALHIGGVIVASVRHRENLIRAMFTGRKHSPGPGDIA